MPSKEQHVEQASKNERFYNSFDLDKTEFLDWAVTALFYSLLHYVDAYLAVKGVKGYHPKSHANRTPLVSMESNLKQIYSKYRRLKDESELARYQIKVFKLPEVRQLKQCKFDPAKNYILALLQGEQREV